MLQGSVVHDKPAGAPEWNHSQTAWSGSPAACCHDLSRDELIRVVQWGTAERVSAVWLQCDSMMRLTAETASGRAVSLLVLPIRLHVACIHEAEGVPLEEQAMRLFISSESASERSDAG